MALAIYATGQKPELKKAQETSLLSTKVTQTEPRISREAVYDSALNLQTLLELDYGTQKM